jgi:multidrug transporter EmrE-like cation transporter
MAALRLGSGVVCVALVSPLHLGERLTPSQVGGFVLMTVSVALITIKF